MFPRAVAAPRTMAEAAVTGDAVKGLIRCLADGRWHSGEELAAAFGITRAGIWKRIQRVQQLTGIELERVSGKGYRLLRPLELLDRTRILGSLEEPVKAHLQALHLLQVTESTNSFLQARRDPPVGTGAACLAEHQTAGRGRRGRRWVCVFGRNLYLSVLWRFDLALQDLAGLSLAAGVALARVLRQAGLEEHRLKWPNDLVVGERKLAGILVEASGEATGPCSATIGVGLNLELEGGPATLIDQPWTELRAHLDAVPGRNELAGALLNELLLACIRFQREGLAPFLEEWSRWDGFLGREVKLITGHGEIRGNYLGLDARGGLILAVNGEPQTFFAGEVSLRRDQDRD